MDSEASKPFVPPESYDPNSPNELGAPPLPNPPTARISDRAVLQPPLSRRGTGPGLIVIVPDSSANSSGDDSEKPLDPEPVQKWAEEGFAIAGISVPSDGDADLLDEVAACVDALRNHPSVDTKDKIGLLICEPESGSQLLSSTSASELAKLGISCAVTFTGSTTEEASSGAIPLYVHHVGGENMTDSTSNCTVSAYPDCKAGFMLPNSSDYQSGPAGIAHTRSLVFLRKHLGGPTFDLEAIWEEHTYWEFERRSVAQTMATMVVSLCSDWLPINTDKLRRLSRMLTMYRQ